jgi:methylglyoxal synthase
MDTMLDTEEWRARRWRVAVVAHEAKKDALLAFVARHRAEFKDWELLATASTGAALRAAARLRVRTVVSGSQGDYAEIGAEIAAGEIDAVIFLRDPVTARPHEREGASLLRVADLHNIALATNLASAECLVRALTPEGAPAGRG